MKKKYYQTENGVDVTNRIDLGYTKLFTDIDNAESFAREKRSYTYHVFCDKLWFGWGVPR